MGLYHGTNREAAASIIHEGLQRGRTHQWAIYLTPRFEIAYKFGPIVFEVELPSWISKSGLLTCVDRPEDEVLCWEHIRPDWIRVVRC